MQFSFCPKVCAKNIKISSKYLNLYPKISSNRYFAEAREIIQKSLTMDSGKVVVFIQTFGPLVSFLYFWGFVLCILDTLFKFFNFSRKIVTSLILAVSPCKNPYSKTFLDINSLFVNRFSSFLQHVLGQKGVLNNDHICMMVFHSMAIHKKPPSKRCRIGSRPHKFEYCPWVIPPKPIPPSPTLIKAV